MIGCRGLITNKIRLFLGKCSLYTAHDWRSWTNHTYDTQQKNNQYCEYWHMLKKTIKIVMVWSIWGCHVTTTGSLSTTVVISYCHILSHGGGSISSAKLRISIKYTFLNIYAAIQIQTHHTYWKLIAHSLYTWVHFIESLICRSCICEAPNCEPDWARTETNVTFIELEVSKVAHNSTHRPICVCCWLLLAFCP